MARRQNVTLAEGEVELIRQGVREVQAMRAVRESDPVSGMIAGIRQWGDETRDIARQVQDATVSMANGMTDSIAEFVMTGKADFRDFANNVIREFVRIAAQQAIVQPLPGGLRTGLSALFPGSAAVAGGDATASVFTRFRYHRGGIVGQNPGMSGGFDPGLWSDALRFHQGGNVGGLGVGERAIVAKDTEAVMPTVRLPDGTFGVRAMGGGGGAITFAPETNIVIEAGGGGGQGGGANAADQQRIAEAVAKQLDQALEAKMQDFIHTQRRAGGALSAGMRI